MNAPSPERKRAPVQAVPLPPDEPKQSTRIPSNEECGRMVKELEKKINGLNAIKLAKQKQIAEDELALMNLDQEMGLVQPKLDALMLVIDLKERKKANMEAVLKEQMASILDLAGNTASLVTRVRTSTRRLDKSYATDVTTDKKGYSIQESISEIRNRPSPTKRKPKTGESTRPKDSYAYV
mmetsp:Transcript_15075/g.28975  ORF Transcript_15075/g.28975 Transcript_15075/m.28975 type:complete len:181 (-) Transcript_15075:330-872(-)|eukprot:CAMPEP_0114247588 /NCGR_PEP_ID=MMETSP0058-20121206/13104_1 /TAXON_ID=36894 /ORGANISM="Pyramimonas parkeae, CCMP726" /LENGTH=180 /DNA_ID=CAMNT_0001360907 /DNA_START=249 /DNA_END=791 /DNA_ORIENTATION=-